MSFQRSDKESSLEGVPPTFSDLREVADVALDVGSPAILDGSSEELLRLASAKHNGGGEVNHAHTPVIGAEQRSHEVP